MRSETIPCPVLAASAVLATSTRAPIRSFCEVYLSSMLHARLAIHGTTQ
jgi:hypothetical protein